MRGLPTSPRAFERPMRRYILLWGYYFISRGPSRGRGTPHAVDAPAVSRSAVLPDGNGELAEEAVRARRERRRAPGALVRRHHRDREQRPERPRVRAVPGDLWRGRRRVRERRRGARVEADLRHAEPRPPRVGRPAALLHGHGPRLHPIGGLIREPGSPRRTPGRR